MAFSFTLASATGRAGQPKAQHAHATAGVWAAGGNTGPDDWGIPTKPPHPDFGQTGVLPRPGRSAAAEAESPRVPLSLLHDAFGRDPVQVAAGGYHTAVLTADGQVCTCGSNAFGQLGVGSRVSAGRLTATQLPATLPRPQVVRVACGYAFTVLLARDGAVFACGFNQNGRLGIPDSMCSDATADGDLVVLAPQRVEAVRGTRVVSIACGSAHCAAIDDAGRLHTWGRNCSGQLGREDRASEVAGEFQVRVQHTPEQWRAGVVSLPSKAVLVDCAAYSTMAVCEDGSLWQWGSTGAGNHAARATPHLVQHDPQPFMDDPLDVRFTEICCGQMVSCATTSRGDFYLVIGDDVRLFPRFGVDVRFKKLAISGYQVVAVAFDGSVYVWAIAEPHARAIYRDDFPGSRVVGACAAPPAGAHSSCCPWLRSW